MKRRANNLGLLLLATLTRLWGLGVPSLWMDEAFSHLFATLPLDTAWQAMIVDAVHPPLYYLLLRPWLVLAGGGEFALRFPSAMAGVLTVALTLRAGRTWLGEQPARWAGLLLALNPFHAWYSQEARMYALLGALALAVLMAFWEALHLRRTWSWAALAALSALAYLTHYFALYLPLIQFVYLVATFRRHHRALGRWTMAQAAAALPFAGWLVALYTVGGGTFGIGWIPRPRAADPLRTLWAFGMAYDGRVTPLVVIGTSVWAALLALGAWRGAGKREAKGLLLLSLILPPLVTFLLSLRRPSYVDRFFIGSLPAFVALAAAGMAWLPRPARLVVGLALAGLGIWGLARFRLDPAFVKEDWRGAATYVEAHERREDVLALRRFQYVIPFGYYYEGKLEAGAVTLNRETTPLAEMAAGHERLWLIFRDRHEDPHHLALGEPFVLERDETEEAVLDWMDDRALSTTVDFAGVTVMLFDLEGGP